MGLIDTHIHLYADEYRENLRDYIEEALRAGVDRFLLPNIDRSSHPYLLQVCEDYPAQCLPMMGLHPCYVKEDFREQLDFVEKELATGRYCAVGEIGLDRHWDLQFYPQQTEALRRQCELALQFKLPVALHTRKAYHETLEIIADYIPRGLKGVFHCFSGNTSEALESTRLGFYLGIGGVLTFKNSGLEEAIRGIDPSFLLLETDGPYLAPAPHRGKTNRPAYLSLVAEKLATCCGLSIAEITRITTTNANDLFRL